MESVRKHQVTPLDKTDKKILFWIITVSLFIYIFTVTGSFGNFDKAGEMDDSFAAGSHQRSGYVQMLSIIHDKDVKLTQFEADRAVPDVAYYKGDFFSFFPPGRSINAIPFYLLGSEFNLGQIATYLFTSLFGIAISILLYISMIQIFKSKKETALFVVFIYGIISYSLVFNMMFMQHTYSSFFFILMFYLVWRFKNSEKNLLFQASMIWLLYGISWFYDYPNSFILAPIILYFYISCVKDDKIYPKIRTKQILFFRTIPILILIFLIHLLYNNFAHGDFFLVSNTLPQYLQYNYAELIKDSEIIAEAKKDLSGAFGFINIPKGLYTLLIDSTRSIFMFSPIFVLIFLVPLVKDRKNIIEKNILWISIFVILFMYASFHEPSGGWSFGPRYLITATLCASILIGLFFEKIKDKMFNRIGILIIALFTLSQTLSGLLGNPTVRIGEQTTWYGIKNLKYIHDGDTRNFMYTEFFSPYISLSTYFIIILSAISLIFIYCFYKKIDKD